MIEYDNIRKNIVRLRELKSLTQEQVAKLAGLTNGTISQVESGKVIPTLHTVQAMAWALGVEPASLLQAHTKSARRGPRVALTDRVGDNLTIIRLGSLISQAKLAREAGMGQIEISRIETGRRCNLTIPLLHRLAMALHSLGITKTGKMNNLLVRPTHRIQRTWLKYTSFRVGKGVCLKSHMTYKMIPIA